MFLVVLCYAVLCCALLILILCCIILLHCSDNDTVAICSCWIAIATGESDSSLSLPLSLKYLLTENAPHTVTFDQLLVIKGNTIEIHCIRCLQFSSFDCITIIQDRAQSLHDFSPLFSLSLLTTLTSSPHPLLFPIPFLSFLFLFLSGVWRRGDLGAERLHSGRVGHGPVRHSGCHRRFPQETYEDAERHREEGGQVHLILI